KRLVEVLEDERSLTGDVARDAVEDLGPVRVIVVHRRRRHAGDEDEVTAANADRGDVRREHGRVVLGVVDHLESWVVRLGHRWPSFSLTSPASSSTPS